MYPIEFQTLQSTVTGNEDWDFKFLHANHLGAATLFEYQYLHSSHTQAF